MRQVLALHCALAAGSAWRPLGAVLEGVTLIAPDLPGHGRAPSFDGNGDYMDAALETALAAMPDGKLDVVGHSYGGALALRLLADHPDRVRSLAVIEPVLFA
ncbi:MAG: alpha/beta fold hydrolase, partial [Jannaschia sp.]